VLHVAVGARHRLIDEARIPAVARIEPSGPAARSQNARTRIARLPIPGPPVTT
jgi:hypothetical protein